jgi:hypothetical protein
VPPTGAAAVSGSGAFSVGEGLSLKGLSSYGKEVMIPIVNERSFKKAV